MPGQSPSRGHQLQVLRAGGQEIKEYPGDRGLRSASASPAFRHGVISWDALSLSVFKDKLLGLPGEHMSFRVTKKSI